MCGVAQAAGHGAGGEQDYCRVVRKSPDRVAPTARLAEVDLPALDPETERWPGEYVDVSGIAIHVRREPGGDGAEPALLIHGLGGSSTNWTDFAAQIGGFVDVEAIDLPGFGRSAESPEHDYSIRRQVATVIAYLVQSGRGAVHLVGNSMGGLIAIEVAAVRPDLVRTLTLISPAVPDVRRLRAHPLKSDKALAFVIVPGLGELGMRRIARLPVAQRVGGTINAVFADASRYPASRLAQDVEDLTERGASQPWAGAALLAATRALARVQYLTGRGVWARMRTIAAPTLVVWGAHDRLVAPDLAAYVAAAIADSRLLYAEDLGHVAMMEDPQLVARAFVALLEDAERSAGQAQAAAETGVEAPGH